MRQGWECPRCKRIYSPDITECFNCRPPRYYWTYPWYPQPYTPCIPSIWQEPYTGSETGTTTWAGTTENDEAVGDIIRVTY